MTIDVLQAAKCLGRMSSWRFSNLELQKIIYICHMLYLGQQGEPLVKGDFRLGIMALSTPDFIID